MSESVLRFGAFELFPVRRQLLEDGRPVRLGSRALDILIVLTRHAGDVLTKDQLIAAVWPDVVVEETNLRVHIAALRKALRDGIAGRRFIASVTGRGYSFVAPLRADAPEPAPPLAVPVSQAATRKANLPLSLTRILGREEVIRSLVEQLPQRRLVTVVGPGGIGKTTVALAATEALAPMCDDGAALADFAPLEDPALVPSAVAAALGIPVRGDDALASLCDALRDRSQLLVLDSCERVVDAVTELVETLLKASSGLLILVTSREPLRAEGEWVQRLPPLGLPPAGAVLTAAEALSFPSVQLFTERAAAGLGGFELRDADVPAVAEICRRLDGIALAIELAAARLDVFGLRELAALLDDRFHVLTRGRRTAVPRHQALRATLDWSYSLLAESERRVLRRLSVFRGGFPLAAARVVAGSEGDLAPAEIGEAVAALVAKSLLAAEFEDDEPQYRLFETTREYAADRLREAGEEGAARRSHIRYHLMLLERTGFDWLSRAPAEWLAEHSRRTDELRAALRWAFADDGDAELGVALTVASVPLWLQLSLVSECLGWVRRALDALDRAEDSRAGRRRRMQLHAAAGWVQMYASERQDSGIASWRTALALAEELGDGDYQSRALWALWADRMNRADFEEGKRLADRFCDLFAGSEEVERLVGERMRGTALHFLGRQEAARESIEGMLRRYGTTRSHADIVRFQFDQRITARMTRARILWLQGFVDQAVRDVEENVEAATKLGHTLSICNTLVQSALPVMLFAGELDTAEAYISLLRRHVEADGLDVWRCYAEGFEGSMLIHRGDPATGLTLLGRAVDALRRARFFQHLTAFQLHLARSLGEVGRATEAIALLDDAMARGERQGDRWALPELLRVRAGIALRLGEDDQAEALLRRSLETAHEQGALSWELRAACTLAEALERRGDRAAAAEALSGVMGRFTEGFTRNDFTKGRRLAERLQAAAATP